MSTIPDTMQAVVCHGPEDYRLSEVPVPQPGPGEALVKVEAVGICASDLKCYHGATKFWGDQDRAAYVETPVTPGHEFVGRVVALERTSALLAGTASTMLRFKTDDALPPELAAQARVTGRIAQIKAHDAAQVEAVLARLRAAGVRVEDLEIGRADLEDVFLDIMQGRAPAAVQPVAEVQ